MKPFAALYRQLDQTTKTSRKVAAMVEYFTAAPRADAAWAVFFLSGERPRRLLPTRILRELATESAGISPWLFEECYEAVGDLAETVSLLVPAAERSGDRPLAEWVEQELLPLGRAEDDERKARLRAAWSQMPTDQILVWNKMITGALRVGVSRRLLLRALSQVAGVDPATLAHRLMGAWQPSAEAMSALLAQDASDADPSRPYPFYLAHALEGPPESLGEPKAWRAEWKWDGIRAQVVRREGSVFIWSRGEELVTDRFPELAEAARALPDGTVIDGELLAWRGGPLSFAELQRRIGRKKIGPKLLRDVPVALVAFDALEIDGNDLRAEPLSERKARLETIINAAGDDRLQLSEWVDLRSWDELAEQRDTSRERGAEGIMLKRLESPYGVGRKRGDWWKWKVDPYSVDAVLLYAQRGHGRRASLFTAYTFGVWKGDTLVPFAKAYSGLTDAEIRQVDRFVRRHTLERFGPVRSVEPRLVFEIAFEGIQRSPRHKSGVAVRFPRMARWRHDKKPEDADTLERVEALLPPSA